jgi:phosphatidylserine/phosphatidylglycerophosphate/cardiolipin synthase-like enzyme
MRRLVFLLILLLIPPSAALQIVEFCPDPYLTGDPDEYLVLEGYGILDGVTISDGEGGFRFPEGSVVSGRLVIARNGAAYTTTHGTPPDYEWYDYSPAVPDVIRSGNLQLANTGDQLTLYEQGSPTQEIAWPRDVTARQGQVHFLEDGMWDPRVLMIGQSRFTPAIFHGVDGVAFTAPDCSLALYEETVSSAREHILVNVYEFTSPRMARSLVDARKQGVNVSVLLEGGPVGGISEDGKGAVSLLKEGGVPVRLMGAETAAHPPYRFDHAKYLVTDRSRVLVTSENFKSNGFPEAGISGNRGWGVVLEDEGLADYFISVYSHDSGGAWTSPAEVTGGREEEPDKQPYKIEFSPYSFRNATVTPVLSPDTSSLVIDLIKDATLSVDIEQAYITNESDGTFNPFLEAAFEAAHRGVQVRVLLDSSYYAIEEDADNDEMVLAINRCAAAEGLPVEARCADLDGNNLEKIHNKGVIADGNKVLVSSINWNTNSPQFNREAGVIIEHPGVAAYFSAVFADDWNSASSDPPDQRPDLLKIGIAVVVIAVLLSVWLWKRKTYWD